MSCESAALWYSVMNRIDAAIKKAKEERRLAFIGLSPVDPDSMEHTRAIADMLVSSGVDILMMHIPNAIPWMEGSVLQKAARAPRNAGVTRQDIFRFLKELRRDYPNLPILDMTLYDTAMTLGQVEFIRLSEEADVDGFDLPNYPLHSTGDKFGFFRYCEESGRRLILDVSYEVATSEKGTKEYELLSDIAEKARGFAFVMNAPGGKSGSNEKLTDKQLADAVTRVKSIMKQEGNDCSISIVCGISNAEDLAKIKRSGAESFMIGSAYIKYILEKKPFEYVSNYIKGIRNMCAY